MKKAYINFLCLSYNCGIFFISDISEQFLFRDHCVTLSYPVFLCLATKSVYISKEPVFRLSKEETKLTNPIDEYNNHSSVAERTERLITTHQLPNLFSDYKVAMNKMLLPLDPEKGWAYIENKIFQIIGRVGKSFIDDILHPSGECKNYVVCNFDFIVNSSMQPQIVDIEGFGILPNKTIMADFVTIALDGSKESFVRVG